MSDNPNFPTGTAVISWMDSSGLHIRVYSTDGYNVIERCNDTGTDGWVTGSFSAPGSNVSATVWIDGGGNVNIRVYCTASDATTEWVNGSSGWVKGDYTTT
ncbi:hypothetical protein P1X14_18430 [Sphingomonas sp. AOB5]|uniref:hypothetical protein n=1 Tax=Sphingomonas sp. AOB5 TaxID=3034017 RepID=UPI0023F75742|nr:hypothetical protein [Sphingomonas sp. AOB5]MDF7777243.1 hypothetical protein [Sphingomonas sp. AOB5]